MKTYIPRKGDISRNWYVVDAKGLRLGRLATRVATILRGKHKPQFTPFLDLGDFVVIINADQVAVTGRKMEQKSYFRHSTYPGGGTVTSLKLAMGKKPEWVVREAVRGMLPHNALGRRLIKKLKVYRGQEHPHQAQKPQPIDVESLG